MLEIAVQTDRENVSLPHLKLLSGNKLVFFVTGGGFFRSCRYQHRTNLTTYALLTV